MSLKQATDAANAAQWINTQAANNPDGTLNRNGCSRTLADMNKKGTGNESPAAELVRRLYWYTMLSYEYYYENDSKSAPGELQDMAWPTDWRRLSEQADRIEIPQLWQTFRNLYYNIWFKELAEVRPDLADQLRKDEETATAIINELAKGMAEHMAEKTGARWCYC